MKAVIFLEEHIDSKIGSKGQVNSTTGSGKLYVKNPSDSTTLWGITLSGAYGPDVKNFDEQKIPHIQASENFEESYTLEAQGNLILTEKIDTHYTGQLGDDLDTSRTTLIKGVNQKVMYEFTLENKYSFALSDVELIKEFDKSLSDFDAIPPHPGTIQNVDQKLLWKFDKLEPSEIVIIYVVAEHNPDTSTQIETGKIVVSALGAGMLSSLVPTIDAECDNVDLSVNVNETASPGTWNITTEYTNASNFTTLLETVKVGAEGNYFLDTAVNEMLAPNTEKAAWSNLTEINSVGYPQIEKIFKYQVDHEIQSSIKITMEKETDHLNVVEISAQKKFEPEQVNTYTRTPFKYTIEVKNVGTSKIGRLVFDETVPPYILIKDVKTDKNEPVKVTISGQEGFDNSIPSDLSQPREMQVEVTNENFLKDSSVTLEVTCIAEKPKPNLDYNAPSIVSAFADNPTESYNTKSLMGDVLPALKVAYKMRSFKFSANYKAVSTNEYEISIPVVNNGEVPLENVFLNQPIMGGKYASHTPLTITAEEKTDDIEFYIKEIPVNETVNIIVTVSTDGPLRQTQPKIRIED